MVRLRSTSISRISSALLFALCASRGAAGDDAFDAPPGFEVSLFADDSVAHDIFSMTIDARGEVVVSGKGYIKILHDRDRDGRADSATLFSDWPPGGAHGMYFDGGDAVVSVGDGLYRLYDENGDGKADRREHWLPSRGAGEHAANGVVKGPDGWYYWICGNDAGIGREHARLPGSPVAEPNCGAVVRVAPDASASDVFADGFRNPYDLDFHAGGEILTYDADGERVQHLPWYTPTRIFDIAQGMHHGWRLRGWQHAWSRPESNLDSVERLWEVGRGSPTGVLVYRHDAFPLHYRGGLFAVCWSLGNIYFFPLERRGSTFATKLEVFLRPAGDTGFAPVDIAVNPAGELFVAIGGRGTRGGVFRVRYRDARSVPRPESPILEVLDAPQPLVSWSRARWVPVARNLGRTAFLRALRDPALTTPQRVRALEILVELFGGLAVVEAEALLSAEPEVVTRVAWALARGHRSAGAAELLSRLTRHGHPRVLRAAWEGLAALPAIPPEVPPPAWLEGFAHAERRVRSASVLAARGPGRSLFARDFPDASRLEDPRHVLGWLLARGQDVSNDGDWRRVWIEKSLEALGQTEDPAVRLDAVRLVQLALGDIALVQDRPEVTDGYLALSLERVAPALRGKAARRLAAAYPSGDGDSERELDRELERVLAMLETEVPGLLEKIAARWTKTSLLEDDVHRLLSTARIPGERSAEFRSHAASAFARLHHKMRADRRDVSRFWPRKMGRALRSHLERDPALAQALVDDPAFGLPEHALFASELPRAEREAAVRKLVARARAADEPSAWNGDLVRLAADLAPDESLPALREAFEHDELRDPVALVLARFGDPSDRARLVEALSTRRSDVARAVSGALGKLGGGATTDELLAALRALRRFTSRREEEQTRAALHGLLETWSGRRRAVKESGDPHRDYAFWSEWFVEKHPEAGAELATASDVVATLAERLRRIDWSTGDAERGKVHFAARGCKSCHVGGQRLGPDLNGVTARLAREDLYRAIAEPSRDISPAHEAKEVVTKSGELYRGLMIYQSPATTLLQVSPDRTVRFSAADVVLVRPSTISFMPEGLLDELDDQQLADLDAYLRTLAQQ